jgi:hypothetical protein
MSILKSPFLLNYILLAIYAGNSIRQCTLSRWSDGLYWLGAFIITIAVTLKK